MKNEKLKKFFSSRAVRSLALFLVVVIVGVAVFVNYKLFYDPITDMGYGNGNMDDSFGDSTQTGSGADGE